MGRGDKQALLALSAEDIEWIIPGEGWPLAGTHRGHAGLADLLQKASETVETSYPEPFEFVAQGDRVLVIGFATGTIIATNKTFEDDWVFAITVQNGKLKSIREYIDTQALAEASEMARTPRAMKKSSKNSMLPESGQDWIPRSLSPFSRRKVTCGIWLRARSFAERPLATLSPPSQVPFQMSAVRYRAFTPPGNVVIVEHRIRGTHDGELAVGSKTVAPTGKAIDVPSADIFRLENGKIVAFNCYSLPSVMQQQLGPVSN